MQGVGEICLSPQDLLAIGSLPPDAMLGRLGHILLVSSRFEPVPCDSPHGYLEINRTLAKELSAFFYDCGPDEMSSVLLEEMNRQSLIAVSRDCRRNTKQDTVFEKLAAFTTEGIPRPSIPRRLYRKAISLCLEYKKALRGEDVILTQDHT